MNLAYSIFKLEVLESFVLQLLTNVKLRNSGLYDMTMLRFEPNRRVGFMEYMRSDGTRSYFFSLDTVRDLFVGAGFIEVHPFLTFGLT